MGWEAGRRMKMFLSTNTNEANFSGKSSRKALKGKEVILRQNKGWIEEYLIEKHTFISSTIERRMKP
jgi:hypothetical protein